MTEYFEGMLRIEAGSGYGDIETLREDFSERLRDEIRTIGDAEVDVWLEKLGHAVAKQRRIESTWRGPTVNDSISEAFVELGKLGIIALEDAGYTTSDGWEDIADAHSGLPGSWGGVFFHRQDVERGVNGEGLLLTFGAFSEGGDHESLSLKLARQVCETLRGHDVAVEWDGTLDTRIRIRPFERQKRRWTNP